MLTGLARLCTLCWALVLLSAVWVHAGDRAPGSPDNGEAPQALAPPPAERPGASGPRPIALADPSLASTPEKRQQLTYLIRCALPADIVVYADVGPDRFTFPGGMGLAPRWLFAALTPSEERWVSACLLAHVNYFGTPVTVSMRAHEPPVPALVTDATEHQTFALFEGGFFGNLFTATPVAYVCRGDRTPRQEADPILQVRICTQETGATTAEGWPITPCRFVVTGSCADPRSVTVEGTPYPEVIFTYLRPTPPE